MTTHNRSHTCRQCGLCKKATAPKGRVNHKCTCRMRPKAVKMEYPSTARTFRNVRLRRPIGLEIELSVPGSNTDAIANRSPFPLQWVHDGSITAGGLEMVVTPVIGQQLVDCLTYLTESFKKYKSTADASCGYHVHVGAEEFSPYELRRLLTLYHQFEDLFYELVQEGRDKTRIVRGEHKCYCKRLTWKAGWYKNLWSFKRGADIKAFLISSLYPDHVGGRRIDMRSIRRHKYEACRYFGLNLHTWFERGTVEYRHHEGTTELEPLLNWALFCGWFTQFASAMTDTQVRQCLTLDHLLLTEWSTGAGKLSMPSNVAAWVYATRATRQALLKKAPF